MKTFIIAVHYSAKRYIMKKTFDISKEEIKVFGLAVESGNTMNWASYEKKSQKEAMMSRYCDNIDYNV